MQSSSWCSSVFFLSYDEPGGPFDHVPPVPDTRTISGCRSERFPTSQSIAVNADAYNPCLPPGGMPTLHCDLNPAIQERIRRRAGSERIRCPTWFPSTEPGDLAVCKEALRLSRSDGPRRDHRFVENLSSVPAPILRTRRRPARPDELLRLHRCPVGDATNSADAHRTGSLDVYADNM